MRNLGCILWALFIGLAAFGNWVFLIFPAAITIGAILGVILANRENKPHPTYDKDGNIITPEQYWQMVDEERKRKLRREERQKRIEKYRLEQQKKEEEEAKKLARIERAKQRAKESETKSQLSEIERLKNERLKELEK